MNVIVGLDFGGTKLAAGVVDAATGRVLAEARRPTPVAGGAAASLSLMFTLAHEVLRQGGAQVRLHAVGVSFGGPVAADGRTVRLSMHVPGWENAPLADRVEQEFGVPAAVANDGDAAALAEHRFGAGQHVQHMLYLTISTGIGGGVIINRQLHRGERAWAGEVGHMVLDPAGPPCPCGRNGCLEALASGLSIARAMRERLGPDAPGELSARDVAAAAAAGDPLAHEVWSAAMRWLGIGVASAANLIDPGCVVLGGGLTRAGELLFAPVREVVAQRALDPQLEVLPAALADQVGILGGAALMIDRPA